ncbi:MAG: hydroxymethylglutaryl-CoA lyase [Flavobacteriaceae bacterium]
MSKIKIIECPRDAMQGIKDWIPTNEKISYIQSLISVGFDIIDFGSFVSERAIPQMKDSAKVLDGLELNSTGPKLLSIVANLRGAKKACEFSQIDFLGYPFSISENFQMRNSNKTIEESIVELKNISDYSISFNKEIVVYLSMGFGNPYGEYWGYDIIEKWVEVLSGLNIKIISISDTVGSAKKNDIETVFSKIINKYPSIEFGAHFHTNPNDWFDKVDIAYNLGCRRFDSAIKGFGGCPMAKDDLTGNLPTEKLITYFNSKKIKLNINSLQFESSYNEAIKLFNKYK